MKVLKALVILILVFGFLSLNAQDTQQMNEQFLYRNGGGIRPTTILTVGLGLAAGGIALYYHGEANKTYDDYKAAIDSQEAVDLYDKASQQDNLAMISAGVGGGLIVFGVIHTILNKSSSYHYRNHNISIRTEQKKHYSGINVSIDLQPAR